MIDIELESYVDPEASMFHNLRYTNDQTNGNSNKATFSIINVGGNNIGVEIDGEYYDVDQVKLHITGAWENAEFLDMLEKILDVENKSNTQNATPNPKTLGDVIRDKMKIMDIMENDQKADDIQVGGTHYKDMAVQPWEVMESLLTPEEFRGFLKGNIIKYAMRQGRKDSDDAGKLKHYQHKLREMIGE